MAKARAKLNLSSPKPSPKTRAAKPDEPTGKGSREGTKLIGGHFSKGTWAKFRQLGVELERTSQDLLAEALADLFAKYRK